LRKADFDYKQEVFSTVNLHDKEKELLKEILHFPDAIQQAAKSYSPALIANYTYDVVKAYNSFYQSVSILGEAEQTLKIFRVQLSYKVGEVIKNSCALMGINVPERM
jgi:arginyl-tRNA synthetase